MSTRSIQIGNSLRRIALTAITCAACASSVRVVTETPDAGEIQHLKTFAFSAPVPNVNRIAVGVTNDSDRVAGAVMDMDPMLATSLVGRAIRQDLADSFSKRGYQGAVDSPDFYVVYYAGTGQVVDTRGSEKSYHVGEKIKTETYVYPAGTIVIDVVSTRSNTVVWRGIGVAEIPGDPEDYARAVRTTVDKIVQKFPKAT